MREGKGRRSVTGKRRMLFTLLVLLVLLLLLLPLFILVYMDIGREQITENEDFFTINKSGVQHLDGTDWDLTVDGMVENPVLLSYEDVTALPLREVTATLKCVEGPSGRAVWRGVPLSVILDMVSVRPGAREVVFHAADGYSSSIELDYAGSEDVILALTMNGDPLPAEQGYPLRLVAPDKAGYKWVMWIVHIEVVDQDYEGYWETRGWDDDADLRPYSDWITHAYPMTIGFFLCGLAMVSGYRREDREGLLGHLPGLFGRRFHIYSSVAFLIVLLSTFIYWAWSTYALRGALFYTSHGAISGLMVALFIGGGVTGVGIGRGNRARKASHRSLNLMGFLLYAGVMLIGFILAAGT